MEGEPQSNPTGQPLSSKTRLGQAGPPRGQLGTDSGETPGLRLRAELGWWECIWPETGEPTGERDCAVL